MSIFQHDFYQQGIEMLPPQKRVDKAGKLSVMVNWVWDCLCYPFDWLNFKMFTDYDLGTNYAAYNSGTTYAKRDRITFNKAVYESIVDNNLNHQPDVSSSYWYKRQDSFIGAGERIKYVDSKLIFEYALNRWFGGTFRQPPSTSDIYITKVGFYFPSFVVGVGGGSAVGLRDSTGYVGTSLSTPVQSDFIIHIPTSLYPVGGDQEIRQFADQINSAENTYQIIQY